MFEWERNVNLYLYLVIVTVYKNILSHAYARKKLEPDRVSFRSHLALPQKLRALILL